MLPKITVPYVGNEEMEHHLEYREKSKYIQRILIIHNIKRIIEKSSSNFKIFTTVKLEDALAKFSYPIATRAIRSC